MPAEPGATVNTILNQHEPWIVEGQPLPEVDIRMIVGEEDFVHERTPGSGPDQTVHVPGALVALEQDGQFFLAAYFNPWSCVNGLHPAPVEPLGGAYL